MAIRAMEDNTGQMITDHKWDHKDDALVVQNKEWA